MKIRKMYAFATAVIMAMSMTACGGGNTPSSSSTPAESGSSTASGDAAPSSSTPAAAAEKPGLYPGTPDPDMITINLGSEPPDLVTLTTTTTGSGDVLRETVLGLTELDPTDTAVPAIADSWESAPNAEGVENMIWTFHLNKDYKWNSINTEHPELNGLPVTAHDFVYAWTQVLTPATGSQYNYMCYIFKNGQSFAEGKVGIEEVGFKAVDDYTLQVELENPLSYLLSQLTFYTFKPVNQQIYETIGADRYNKDANTFFANGPYKMTEWVHEDSVVLEKNEMYPKADTIKCPKIKFAMISDSNTALNAFKAGELDMIGLTGDQVAMLEAEGQPCLSYSDGGNWYFQYNTTKKGLDNKKIRKALTMAVDNESYIKNVRKDKCTISKNFVSDSISGTNGLFVETLAKEGITFEFDAAAAKALLDEGLAEAGITLEEFNALGYTITTDAGDTSLRDAQFYQEQWKTNLGVEVGITQMTYQARVEATHQGNYDISLFGWGPDYNDPMTFLDLWITGGGNNDSRYSNAAYDELITKAKSEADPATREGYFIECERILNEDMPCGPSYNRYRDYVVSDKVNGLIRTTFQNINANNVEIAG